MNASVAPVASAPLTVKVGFVLVVGPVVTTLSIREQDAAPWNAITDKATGREVFHVE
jgi:hypothetical protein